MLVPLYWSTLLSCTALFLIASFLFNGAIAIILAHCFVEEVLGGAGRTPSRDKWTIDNLTTLDAVWRRIKSGQKGKSLMSACLFSGVDGQPNWMQADDTSSSYFERHGGNAWRQLAMQVSGPLSSRFFLCILWTAWLLL